MDKRFFLFTEEGQGLLLAVLTDNDNLVVYRYDGRRKITKPSSDLISVANGRLDANVEVSDDYPEVTFVETYTIPEDFNEKLKSMRITLMN